MSVYVIEIHDELDVPQFPVDRVIEAVRYVLARHEVEEGTALTIVVTGDEQVRELNRQFRDVDAATDVLSFPADPLPEEMTEEGPYLGDLVIAYPYSVHQAEEAGHSLDDELILLVVHGTLHLLGYDHDDDENQATMWEQQQDALDAAGVSIDVPRYTFGDFVDS